MEEEHQREESEMVLSVINPATGKTVQEYAEDAIKLANNSVFGLGAAIFTPFLLISGS